ncbi:MAG: PAS domain-containing protein [Deltaproteobacteria bacterium]|nr:PAS domain-containing protein [Deltaproteobacteria bacterium]
MKLSSQNRYSNIIRIGIFILAVFVCEAIVMAAMAYLFHRSLWGGLILVDAGILIIVLLPAFYFLLYRPMERQMRERRYVLDALEEREKKYRLMMEAMHDPVYICSADYKVLYMNPAMIKRTGRDAVGESCYRVVHGRDEICPWCVNDKVLRGNYAEYEVVSPADGRFYNAAQAPIFNLDGRIDKMVVLRDFTRYKETEEKLRAARDGLERRVDERTGMLKETNLKLIREIDSHKVTENALKNSEEQLRGLNRKLITSQEEERRLIAMELHDGIGQILSAIKFKVESGLHEMNPKSPDECLELQLPVVSLVQQAVEEVRRISKNLRPPILDDVGILATLSWFCREFNKIYENICVEKEIMLDEEVIPQHFKISIFRVLQEAFNNVAKHSGADLVRVVLEKRDAWVTLLIEDNGQGFDVEAALGSKEFDAGMGLASMRERATLSGGTLKIDSAPGKGTRIQASFPAGN